MYMHVLGIESAAAKKPKDKMHKHYVTCADTLMKSWRWLMLADKTLQKEG